MNLTLNVTGYGRLGRLALTGTLLLAISGCTGGPQMAGLRSLRNKPEEKQGTEAKEETASFRRLFDREPAPEKTAARTASTSEAPGNVRLGSYTRNPSQVETNGETQLVADWSLREKPAEEDPFLNVPATNRPRPSAPPAASRTTPPAAPAGNNQFVEGFDEKLKQLQQEVARTEKQSKPTSQAAPFPGFDEPSPAPSRPFPEIAATPTAQPSAPQEPGVFRLGPPQAPAPPTAPNVQTAQVAPAAPQAPAFPPETAGPPAQHPAPEYPPASSLVGNPQQNPFAVGPVPQKNATPGFPGITSTQPDPTILTQRTPRNYPLEANGPSPNEFAPPGSQPVITSRNDYLNSQQEKLTWQHSDNQAPQPMASAPRKSIFPDDWEPADKREVTPVAGMEFPDDIYPEAVRQSVPAPPTPGQPVPGDNHMITSSDQVPSRFESRGHFAKLDQGWKSTPATAIPASELEEPAYSVAARQSVQPDLSPQPGSPAELPMEPVQPQAGFPMTNQEPTPASQTVDASPEWGDYHPEDLQATPVEQLKLFVPLAEEEGVVRLNPDEELNPPGVVSLNPFEEGESQPLEVAAVLPVIEKQELPIPQAELPGTPAKTRGTVLPPVELEEEAAARSEKGSSPAPWFLGALLLAAGVGFGIRKRMQLQQLQSAATQQPAPTTQG